MEAFITRELQEARIRLNELAAAARAQGLATTPEADAQLLVVRGLEQRAGMPESRPREVACPGTAARADVTAASDPRAAPIWRSALVQLESAITGKPMSEIVTARYGGLTSREKDFVGLLCTKAAQNPANTFTPGWAAELVRTTYAAFLADLAKVSVLASLPLVRVDADGSKAIIPTRDTTAATPNLAAGWRKEGAPIRVGAVKFRAAQLAGYHPAVIGTWTEELFRASTPSIEAVIRAAILEDTAAMFDTKFLSGDAAVVDVSPAGIRNGLPAGNSIASSGNAPNQVAADLKAALVVMLTNGFAASRFVWAMHPANAVSLGMMTTAAGTLAFPTVGENGLLAGYPIAVSANVPADMAFLIATDSIALMLGAPEFFASREATIHEEDATPLPIVDDATTPVVAQPVRSLYQTYSGALRAVYTVDWAPMRPAPLAVISGVAW